MIPFGQKIPTFDGRKNPAKSVDMSNIPPLFRGFYTSFRWLGMGFLKHQQSTTPDDCFFVVVEKSTLTTSTDSIWEGLGVFFLEATFRKL